ncbi:MAG: 5-phospho-D-xylono,4-lactonase [Thermosediminibacterales bacterium]|nr:5-phospho-D-xylono,4-lactonase [Thermosediminibacterales bacterium]
MYVQTIFGRKKPEELGITYIHEHLYSNPPQWVKEQDSDLVLDDILCSIQEAKTFKKVGGQTIVDMTAVDYGRNIEILRSIAKAAKINVIATTGFNKGLFFDKWVYEAEEKDLTEWMITEITEGIEATDSKAGIIKVGSGYNKISQVEEKVIRAASKAHLETGAPIAAHTESGTMALEQLEIMEKEGVDLNKVIIAHADRNIDLWYFKQIGKKGAYIEFDGPSKIKYYPDSMRVDAIIELVKSGFEDKILISGDMARKSYLEAYGGGPGFRFIIQKFIPRLKMQFDEEGLNPDIVNKFIVLNPQRALTFK